MVDRQLDIESGRSVKELGDLVVVSPESQQSAVSHSITLHKPLRCNPEVNFPVDGVRAFATNGTPTDAVLLGIHGVFGENPDVVLSGINSGPNLGFDVTYSGTVAAAMEGTILGFPSYAISLATWHPTDFTGAAEVVHRWLPEILSFPLPRGTLLNINIPEGPPDSIAGLRVVRLGSRVYHDVITDHEDPRGRPYLWIGGHGPTWNDDLESDNAAVRDGYVAVTPLKIDLTHDSLLSDMQHLSRRGTPLAGRNNQPESRKA